MGEWISINDKAKRPLVGDKIIVTDGKKEHEVVFLGVDGFIKTLDFHRFKDIRNVTHWKCCK